MGRWCGGGADREQTSRVKDGSDQKKLALLDRRDLQTQKLAEPGDSGSVCLRLHLLLSRTVTPAGNSAFRCLIRPNFR